MQRCFSNNGIAHASVKQKKRNNGEELGASGLRLIVIRTLAGGGGGGVGCRVSFKEMYRASFRGGYMLCWV